MNSLTPALRQQHNGWTAARQQRFLDHLAVHGNVSAAARSVGMSRWSAYLLRRQPYARDFADAWDAALAETGRLVEDIALERLLEGEEEVIERDGATVAVRRRPGDVRLLLFFLQRQERRREKDQEKQRRIPPDSASVAKLRAEIRALAGETDGDAEA